MTEPKFWHVRIENEVDGVVLDQEVSGFYLMRFMEDRGYRTVYRGMSDLELVGALTSEQAQILRTIQQATDDGGLLPGGSP